MTTADVIIVGAGAAGLAAANRLSQSGLRVVILEARDRIGGRILTLTDPSVSIPVELGAEFLHGKARTVLPLIRKAQLGIHEVGTNSWMCSPHGLKKSHAAIEAWEETSKAMKNAALEQSFKDFIQSSKLSDETKDLATRYVEGFHAAHNDRVSIQSLVLENEASDRVHGDKLFVLDRGYASLMRCYADDSEATIRLDSCVRTVEWARGSARVECSGSSGDETLTGRAALITIPLPLLQSAEAQASIRFEPDLPAIRAAARQLAMGQAMRISLSFSEPIWDEAAGIHLGFIFCPDAPFPTWWVSRPRDANVITAWAGGPPAEEIQSLNAEQLVSKAVQTLSRVLKMREAELQSKLITHYFHDWHRDPFSLGAYSYTPVGCFKARSMLATPIEETLFFAGEALNTTGAHGTVHGAVESGLLAARSIIKAAGK